MNQNFENVTEPTTIPSVAENFTAASIILILSLIGLLAYILIIVILLRYRSQFYNPFYRYLLSLAFSDMMTLCLTIFYTVPVTIWQDSPKKIARIVGCLLLSGFYSNIFCMTSISVNRYYAVRKPSVYNQKYNTFRVRLNIFVVWSLSLFLALIPYLSGKGGIDYNYQKYSFDMKMGDSESSDVYMKINQVFVMISLVVLFICYCYIVTTLRSQRKVENEQAVEEESEDQVSTLQAATQNKRNEVVFSLQFLGIGLYLFICISVSFFVPILTQYHWYLYIVTTLFVGNACINPFIYLLTNYQLRDKVFEMFGIRKPIVSDSPVPVTRRINPQPANMTNTSVAAVNLYLSRPFNKHGHAKYDMKPDLAMMRMKMQEAKSID